MIEDRASNRLGGLQSRGKSRPLEQRQRRLGGPPDDLEIDLDAVEASCLCEHTGLRLELLRGEQPAAIRELWIEPQALDVARQLLDSLDRPGDALHLDRHPAPIRVAADEIDGPDVGRPLAPDEAETLAEPRRRGRERRLQLRLDALLLKLAAVAELVATSLRTSLTTISRRSSPRSFRTTTSSSGSPCCSTTVGGVIQFSGL